MYNRNGLATLGAVLLGLGLASPSTVSAAGNCIPITGKAFNNALGPGSTLGTAHVILGKEKLKCGIRGDGKNQNPDDPDDIGPLNFDHTIVCDDDVGAEFPVHSQIVLDTSGYPTAQPIDCGFGNLHSFPFLEVSKPVPGTGTGRFQGITGGSLTILGSSFCTLAIDMEFTGELCF